MIKTIIKPVVCAGLLAASSVAFAQDMPAGDVTKGAKVFKKCMACHEAGADAKNKVGPILTGLIGRSVASVEDYKYGKSIKALGESGKVWDADSVFAYLANPKNYLREVLDDKKAKSKMAFKLKKEQDRADVIAYLQSL